MSVLVEFSMFPTDKGESVSKYVSRILKMIQQSGVKYKLSPMGTVFETEEMQDALDLINKAYRELEPDCGRIYTNIKMDIRKGKSDRIHTKIKSIEDKIGIVDK